MTRAEFLRDLRGALKWPELTEDTVLQGDQRWDSLGQIEVLMLVEDRLGATLEASALQDAGAVRDVLALVASRLD